MRHCLWKEFRERGWWALLWTLAILGVSLFDHGQAFCGEKYLVYSPWHWLPLGLAVLVGMTAYAGESDQRRALFIFARPISWSTLWGAKLCFGLIFAFGAPALAALLFRLFGPAIYHPFETLSNTLFGIWIIAWKFIVLYLLGMGCSTLVRGLAGAFLTLCAFVAVAAIELMGACLVAFIGHVARWNPPSWMLIDNGERFLVCLAGSVGMAVILTGSVAARFGLTLETAGRVRRLALPFLVCLLAGWVGAFLLNRQAPTGRWEYKDSNISPRGTYAIIDQQRQQLSWGYFANNYSTMKSSVVRLVDGQSLAERSNSSAVSIPYPAGEWEWLADDLAIVKRAEKLFRFTPQHGVQQFDITPFTWMSYHSPDGHYLIISRRIQPKGHDYEFGLYDLRAGRTASRLSIEGVLAGVKWGADAVLVNIRMIPGGKRGGLRVVRLTKGGGQ
jgi:hypothetical protein